MGWDIGSLARKPRWNAGSAFDLSDRSIVAYLTQNVKTPKPRMILAASENGVNYLYIARSIRLTAAGYRYMKPGESVKTAVSVFLPSGSTSLAG